MKQYRIAEIAKMLRITKRSIATAIQSKQLKCVLQKDIKQVRYAINRDDLLDWLVKCNFPIKEFRYLFIDTSRVIGCGISARQQSEIKGIEIASSLFRLGYLLGKAKAAVVIVSMHAINREDAIEAARTIDREVDRPYLIGLVGDDETNRPGRAADVFDILLSHDINPVSLSRVVTGMMEGINVAPQQTSS